MSSGSYRQVNVRCPFYRSDDGKNKISCEGITADSCLDLRFRRKRSFEKQMEVFCCEKFENCELYRAIVEKYE